MTILTPDHPHVQMLVRRYMFCIYRDGRAPNVRLAKPWRVAAKLLGEAISRLIGSDNWEFPYFQIQATHVLRTKAPAIVTILSS